MAKHVSGGKVSGGAPKKGGANLAYPKAGAGATVKVAVGGTPKKDAVGGSRYGRR